MFQKGMAILLNSQYKPMCGVCGVRERQRERHFLTEKYRIPQRCMLSYQGCQKSFITAERNNLRGEEIKTEC
jgi:hypothetical protein